MSDPARKITPDSASSNEVLAPLYAQMIEQLGYDPSDAHLIDSPARVARFMREWHTITAEPPKLTVFPNTEHYDQMVAVGGIRFYSMCAHHGLPFIGTAAVGYLPSKKIVGLSKIARVVDHFSRRFQTQERLTKQIADHLESVLDPHGTAVVMRAEHLCMSMRGIERPGHLTITSDMRGSFRQSTAAREELLKLALNGGTT